MSSAVSEDVLGWLDSVTTLWKKTALAIGEAAWAATSVVMRSGA
ncbi:hypothetical protein [Streptomyces sp. NBC_01766]|nr:hypothetical protein [Streptomyces sp. NBC_01766]WSC24958.1 hypothetical protein OIE60_35435 [Streptomyces sp. NBC_01766]